MKENDGMHLNFHLAIRKVDLGLSQEQFNKEYKSQVDEIITFWQMQKSISGR
jgi:hypothetical protein